MQSNTRILIWQDKWTSEVPVTITIRFKYNANVVVIGVGTYALILSKCKMQHRYTHALLFVAKKNCFSFKTWLLCMSNIQDHSVFMSIKELIHNKKQLNQIRVMNYDTALHKIILLYCILKTMYFINNKKFFRNY